MFGPDELAKYLKSRESSDHLSYPYQINKRSKYKEMSNTEAIIDMVENFDVELKNFELDDLIFPNIIDFLPHITNDLKSLRPTIRISKGKFNISMIMGIPTVKREKESYLITTLHSIFKSISKNSTVTEDILIVVMIAEVIDLEFVNSTTQKLQREFGNHIESGYLDIIVPSPGFYPNFSNIDLSFGDGVEQVKWRSKQNLDYAYLMTYAKNRGSSYYVQLEDDVMVAFKYLIYTVLDLYFSTVNCNKASKWYVGFKRNNNFAIFECYENFKSTPNFVSKMKSFADSYNYKNWIVIEFCKLGFIGKMFKSSNLSMFVQFFITFFKDKPVDWLLSDVISTKVCTPKMDAKACQLAKNKKWIRYPVSLFKHIGVHSSLKGKVWSNKGEKIDESIASNSHTRSVAYHGSNLFGALMPKESNMITSTFKPRFKLNGVGFVFGKTELWPKRSFI